MSKKLTTPSHLNKLFKAAGIEISKETMTAAEHMQEGIKKKQKSVLETIAAGLHFTQARDLEGSGFITTEAARLGVGRASIYRDIDIYQLFKRSPAESVSALRQLDFTKLLYLKRLDNSEIQALTSGEEVRGITLEDAIDLPSRELERRLKESEISNNELAQQLEKEQLAKQKAEEQVRLLKRRQNEIEGFNYPPSVERVRIESSVLASQANKCLDDMEQFMTELTQAGDLSSDKGEQLAQFSAGATTLYVNLKSVYAKASYLMRWFPEAIGEDYMPEAPEDTPLMTEQEALKVHSMREVMLIEHEMEKQARESTRKSKRRTKRKA